MNGDHRSKIVAIVTLGMLTAAYIQHDYHRWGERGKEAFVAYQTQRFEHYMASPRPFLTTAVSAIAFVFVLVWLYEIIVRVVSKLFDTATPEPGN